MSRYLRVWALLLRMSWRHARALTVLHFCLQAGTVLSVVGTALSLRLVVDAAIRHDMPVALVGALGTAAACMTLSVIDGLMHSTAYRLVDQVSHAALDPRIVRNVADIDGIEHLERAEYLDRITVLRNSSWGLLADMWAAVSVVFSTIQLALSLALLGSVSPWLMVILVFAAVPLWCDRRGRSAVTKAETDTAEQFRLQRHHFDLATSASAGRELRVTGATEEVLARQAEAWAAGVAGRLRARVQDALWGTAGRTVFVLGFAGTVALVIFRSSRGGATPGDLVMVITVSTTLMKSLGNSLGHAAGALRAGRLLEPFLWLEDYATTQRARIAGQQPPPLLTNGIRLEGVSHRYAGADRPAIEEIDLHLPAGAVVAVVGEYGSGKTTLVKLLAKFYTPGQGRITVDGVPLDRLDTASWRARISATYQDFGRYTHTTLAECVGVGDLSHVDDRHRIASALRAADAEALVAGLPRGLDTELDPATGGVGLSEGQWQKTALARSSMRADPLLFVLDEPTASLDAPSEKAIYERYIGHARTLARRSGTITVIVSHRFSTVTSADLVLVFAQGHLVEHGTHDELMATAGVYHGLYSLHATAYSTPPTPDGNHQGLPHE